MPRWPDLNMANDHPTLAILHMAAQMLGKIRVANAPWANHGWHAALQPTATGLATLPTSANDGRTFMLTLDLCRHAIILAASDSTKDEVRLEQPTIQALYKALIAMLERHSLPARFNPNPSELPEAVGFAEDDAPRKYAPASADRFREAVAAMLPVFEHLRAGFSGKSSPVHFWWGAFDLAVSRFSGRTAPPHPGGMPGLPDRIAREAYSHEVASSGFWAGGATEAEPFFYSYIYPEPNSYREAKVAHGHFDTGFGEFILPYSNVVRASDPGTVVADFFETAYEAGANLAGWDRTELERMPVPPT